MRLKLFLAGPRCVFKHFVKKYSVSLQDVPEINTSSIKKTLKAHNIRFNEGYTCLLSQCPICNNNEKPAIRNFYINKTTGMFVCASCKTSGTWNSLQKYFRQKSKEELAVDNTKHHEILTVLLEKIRNDTDILSAFDQSKLLPKFKLPMISETLLNNFDIRVDKSRENIYFPIENASSELVGYRQLSSKGNDVIIPSTNYGGLLTLRRTENKSKGILVPTIHDFLLLLNIPSNYSIICLPNGFQTLPQIFLPSFEKYEKLIFLLNTETKYWDMARQFSKKLGDERCTFVRDSDKKVTSVHLSSENLGQIIDEARPFWHKSVTTFASFRQDVLNDLQNVDKVEGIKWKRFPILNKILRGHRRGELTVMTGPTGSGKTTFISEYSLDLAMQNVNTLWGSFEIANSRLAKTMLYQLAGLPLHGHMHLFNHWADQFEKLPIFFMNFHGQQTLKVVMDAIQHATYVHDIAHVIIDNLQFMLGITEEHKHMDRFWKQDVVIAAFRTFATQSNCHVTLVIHPRKERIDDELTASSIFGSAKATQEADNVLILQDQTLVSIKGKKYLQVVKNRFSGDLGVMPLEFNKSALSFAKKKKCKSDTPQE